MNRRRFIQAATAALSLLTLGAFGAAPKLARPIEDDVVVTTLWEPGLSWDDPGSDPIADIRAGVASIEAHRHDKGSRLILVQCNQVLQDTVHDVKECAFRGPDLIGWTISSLHFQGHRAVFHLQPIEKVGLIPYHEIVRTGS